jgi:TRAP-type C4-dicarboxylate transport system permease small subunit
MSSPDDSRPAESLAPLLGWLGRLAVVALGLWFIADGLREKWAPADGIASVLVYAVVVLAAAFAVVGLVHLVRRARQG